MNIERIQKTSGMVGGSDAIHEVLDMVAQVAPIDISVLVTGESGTGKELVAKALHQNTKFCRWIGNGKLWRHPGRNHRK